MHMLGNHPPDMCWYAACLTPVTSLHYCEHTLGETVQLQDGRLTARVPAIAAGADQAVFSPGLHYRVHLQQTPLAVYLNGPVQPSSQAPSAGPGCGGTTMQSQVSTLTAKPLQLPVSP